MKVAETLYAKGYISYPRTETEIFHPSTNLRDLVALHTGNTVWGQYASNLLGGTFTNPRRGSKDDQAHPPIHPLKSGERHEFETVDEYKIFELVVRRFLACVSPDAKGSSSKLEASCGTEIFQAEGLTVLDRGWLEVYPYAKWTSTAMLPPVRVGDRLNVAALDITSGATEAPHAISEPELLALMDKEGIGTDATMHEHINTIQDRGYCYRDRERFFIPTDLGTALVIGLAAYEPLGFHLAKPQLRAAMERDMQAIAEGRMTRPQFISTYTRSMREIFTAITDNPVPLDMEVRPAMTAAANGGNDGAPPAPPPPRRRNISSRPARRARSTNNTTRTRSNRRTRSFNTRTNRN
jgi:DNA topoisomerase-3